MIQLAFTRMNILRWKCWSEHHQSVGYGITRRQAQRRFWDNAERRVRVWTECEMCEGWGRVTDPEAETSHCQCGGTGYYWKEVTE